jgi:hypothetical protein
VLPPAKKEQRLAKQSMRAARRQRKLPASKSAEGRGAAGASDCLVNCFMPGATNEQRGPEVASRREFFRTAARYTFLTAIVAVAGSLIARKRVDASAAGCTQSRFCAECVRLSFCQLPPAPAARLALKPFKP